MKAQPSTLPKLDEIKEKWYLVDAEGLVVGRLAARVAKLLRGKLDPSFSPHIDPKIHVIITNADKVVFTGTKLQDKTYYRHSRYRTGIKATTARELLEKQPEEILRRSIHGMLPKNRLGRKLDKHVKIYRSGDYKDQHAAQQPETLKIKTRVPKGEELPGKSHGAK